MSTPLRKVSAAPGSEKAREASIDDSPEVRPLADKATTRLILTGLRAIGALALIAMGALHLQQYYDAGYSAIPTIGTLFVLNFVGGVALGLALLLPLERLPGRAGTVAVPLLAFTGAAMAATAFVFLLISQQTPVFGWLETAKTSAIPAALYSEAVATVALAIVAAASAVSSRPRHLRPAL